MISVLVSLLVVLAAFLFVFSIVVIIHELGHYWVARWCGVRIEAFSIGFGKQIFGWKDRHGTLWRVAALPLGGYVRFWGDVNAASAPDRNALAQMKESMEAEHGVSETARCFHFKPVWQRMAVTAAGPFANFLLAIVLFAGLLLVFGQREIPARISGVVEGSAAAEAGMEPGDLVVSADRKDIRYFSDLSRIVMLRRGDTIPVAVERDGERLSLEVTLKTRFITDDFGQQVPIGGLGVEARPGIEDIIDVRHTPFSAIGEGAVRTWRVVETTGHYIARLVSGRENADQLGSVLRIGAMSGKVAERAYNAGGEEAPLYLRLANVIVQLLQLTAFLSVSLGLINLLPIPMLDGGHLVFYAYEAVVGRPIAAAVQEWGLRIGLALILSFMVFATLNDLRYLRVFEAIGNLFS
jgi:regulator of sigma E protease